MRLSAAGLSRLATTTVLVLLIVGGISSPAAQASSANATGALIMYEDLAERRDTHEVQPLKRVGLMDTVAQNWSEYMLANNHFDHNPHFFSQIPQTGLRSGAENVAYACGWGGPVASAQIMAEALFDSPGHRANILGSQYTHVGIGFAYHSGSDCAYATQVFGHYDQEFFDVPLNHQFYSDITWLAESEITSGYASGNFHPKSAVTREAFAAFLYRMAGRPGVSLPSQSPFSDVPTNAQFYREIVWLSQQGITTGWADGTFRPKNYISREAMAAFLYRYYDEPAAATTSATKFSDIDLSSKFLREISWMESVGITTGYSDGTFRPYAAVTREATAAFLRRSTTT